MNIITICSRIIEYSFYALFLLVPLAFASDTFELFEFNKMWLTYALTIIIGTSWFIKMIIKKQVFIQRTPLDIPIILFLLSQIISTIFSWDTHISFWGYYSRFNGGLLSIISYIFLYYAFLSNFHEKVSKDTNVPKVSNGKTKAPFDTSDTFDTYSSPSSTTIIKRLLFVSLFSGLVVALWGLPSHFGYDPTCLIFRGTLDTSCWTTDFQPMVRIFSTLGQPDWLAAYLAILIPIAIAFGIKNSKSEAKYRTVPGEARNPSQFPPHPFPLPRGERVRERVENFGNLNLKNWNLFRIWNLGFGAYLLLSALFYLALLYTRARSGVLATWLSLAFFFAAYLWMHIQQVRKFSIFNFQFSILLLVFLSITFFAGQPFPQLEKFTLEGIKKNITNTKTAKNAPIKPPEPQRFAAEFGGTDSGKIRKIVWQGAIDAWRQYPIFGTGVETFAFAYYRFKPEAHNLTSEWNFLYNKAHNEFLNYLATTGTVGLGTYIFMIGSFIFLFFKRLNPKSEIRNPKQYQNSNDQNSKRFEHSDFENSNLFRVSIFEFRILNVALLSGYLSILVTNFFGFSVVITNIYLFMIPAFVFVLMGALDSQKALAFPKLSQVKTPASSNYHITPWRWTFIILITITAIYMLIALIRFWIADKAYALGNNLDKAGEYREAYPHLQKAVEIRAGEPVFKDELAINNAVLAAAFLTQEDAKSSTDSAVLASNLGDNAIALSNFITSKYPNNVVFWKNRVRVFYSIGQVDSRYLAFALEAIKRAKELAPTDANISYNLGVLYGQNGDVPNGIRTLENTIKLKPDYRDAYYALGLFYHDQAVDENGNVVDRAKLEIAISKLEFILNNLGAEDKVAKETLEQWKKL